MKAFGHAALPCTRLAEAGYYWTDRIVSVIVPQALKLLQASLKTARDAEVTANLALSCNTKTFRGADERATLQGLHV